MPTRWTWKLALPLAALVFGIAAGTGAYAMRGDDGGDRTVQADQDESLGERQMSGDDGSLAICIEGATDCADTPLGDEPCPEDGCSAMPAPCPPDSACIEPWLMDPPTCPEDVPAEECKRLIEEGGYYDCVTLESDPPQTKCVAVPPCDTVEGPITTLPGSIDPADDSDSMVDPIDGADGGEEINPAADDRDALVDPLPCPPIDECGVNVGAPDVADDAAARCLPPDCSVSSDGAVACPEQCVPGPAVDCGPPVDCVVGSDGSVSCPGSPPTIDECNDPNSLVRCAEPMPGVSGGGTSGSAGEGVDPTAE
jgi:hypothetical protein